MRITVHAVGRMKAGPEKELADRYLERFARSGPTLGLDFGGVIETPESRARDAEARKREEGQRLKALAAEGAEIILLDERGKNLTSQAFAERIGTLRDSGKRSLVVAIGGADGHDAGLHQIAGLAISFGAATWPHQMVRIMLAEQLYRAATILGGHPYHRA